MDQRVCKRATTLCTPSARSGTTEECPGGTSLSVALLRHVEKMLEDVTQRTVIRESNAEGEDVVRENSATPVSDAGKDESGQSSAVSESEAGTG
ncbi:hypothetical protein NDU88_003249 [Pleurodeles waltl]|uniref:Uncharacterized protein n=1 Tax=Pleurodeles waltl TaxID=8319 RepID=A0AAV7W1L2_PLEWA|nr:hypothetical protein NDU88_003249 [Pleurodeles waltl]